MKIDVEKERGRFERACGDRVELARDEEGYFSSNTRFAFDVWLAAKGQAMEEMDIASIVEGLAVSVDVSTGDHDSGNRYFGYIGEVMECETEPHGVILLVHDVEPNFDTRTLYAKKGE